MKINDHGTYIQYMEELFEIMEIDPHPNSPLGERLNYVALAIKEYENKNLVFDVPSQEEHEEFLRQEKLGLCSINGLKGT